jgi:YD repeat-containing protein
LFNSTGAYLGLSNTTDANGQVSYDLPEGTYKYRVDSLGYQFWTGLYEVPNVASDVFTIPHQDVTITVQGADPGLTPLEGVDVYLFTPSDAYLGLKLTTDPNGQAAFNLPEKPFKVRADFLGRQFWSGVFPWQDTAIDIPRGTVELHVHLGGAVIPGAKVYLFSESGAYLGWFEVTDKNGKVSFLLPYRPYKFRIDYNGGQYWSDDVTAAAGTSSPVDIDLTPPTVDIGAAPSSINVGGASTLSWNATNAYSCIIEPDIGEVDVNGTYVVSPSVTTTYTITATGPGGSVSDSIEVLVGATLSDDLDLGVAFDEQQGGGGLVAESVRLLNGNVIEARADVGVASPNSMGLSFTAAYNSRSSIDGSLGYGWSHTYSATLDDSATMFGQVYIRITGPTGRAAYFLEESPGVYKGAFKEKSSVRLEAGEYVWYRLDGSRYGFAADGKLNWIEDEKGNRLNLAYDAGGRIDTVTDAASSRVLSFSTNAEGLITAISGPVTAAVADGVWVRFAYDGNRNLTAVTYADGSGVEYSYTDTNDIHNLNEKRNKANHLIDTWGYDDDNNSVPNENPTRLIARILEKGFTHDTSSAVAPYEYITLLTHNAKGQLLSVDGPRPGAGDTTSLDYDAQNGNLLSIMRPLIGATVLSSYDATGQVGTVTDVNGRFEQLVYDGRGRVTAITHAADGSSRTTAFNTAGLPGVTTNEDNVGIDRVYDPVYGRLDRIIDPENNYIAFAYDSQGNLIEKSKHEASGTRTSRKRWNYHPAIPTIL